MAISTYKTFLMKGTGTGTPLTYTKLIDIKDFPDLDDKPEMIDVTTLSDPVKKFIPGVGSGDALEFTANYTKTDYTTLKALEGTEGHFAVWFGGTVSGGVVTPDGSDGKFSFEGNLFVHTTGKGVGEATDILISIYPTSTIAAE